MRNSVPSNKKRIRSICDRILYRKLWASSYFSGFAFFNGFSKIDWYFVTVNLTK